jgi:glycosyltransferase involved in cell wall biosynthesis
LFGGVGMRDKMTVVALSWHPEGGMETAGGFRRGWEILRRLGSQCAVVAIDSRPSMYRGDGFEDVDVVEYDLPVLPRLTRRSFAMARSAQWAVAILQLSRAGLRAARRSSRPVVYVPSSELLPCAVAGALVTAFTGTPLVLSNHNVYPLAPAGVRRPASRLFRWLTRLVHQRASAITVSSEALVEQLRELGVHRPTFATRNGPTAPMGIDDADRDRERLDAIFIGRHTTEKGVFDAVRIWHAVASSTQVGTLLLVGRCSESQGVALDEMISQFGLGRHVRRMGVVSDAEKFDLLERSRVLVATSRVEGWGFTPLEALACHTPTVCWDLPAYLESLPKGPAIARVGLDDESLFVKNVTRFLGLSDQERREAVASTARQAPSWDEVAAAELEVLTGSSVR